MARRKVPSYRLFKPKNLGLVVLDGHQHYLGKYGSPESLAEYNRLIQEWLSHSVGMPTTPTPDSASLTIDELLVAFWDGHATRHYRHPDGSPTGELANFRDSLRQLRALYGHTAAQDFGPMGLKAVRGAMIGSGLARTTINQRIGRIIHLFKWAVANELIPASVHHGLSAVSGLSRGRSDARETAAIRPVAAELVLAVQPHVSRQVWAMIELQRITGMRPGEVCVMKTGDLDRSRSVWFYTPSRHKSEHRGDTRVIYLGPRSQQILKPWLRLELDAYLFSPTEAIAERRARIRTLRKTKVQPSQRDRSVSSPSRCAGRCYSPRSYYHAIRRACLAAGVARWHPHQLRHSAATEIRKEFGLDVARVILGHRSPLVTEIYAELDQEKAVSVMARIG
jgi:integrase